MASVMVHEIRLPAPGGGAVAVQTTDGGQQLEGKTLAFDSGGLLRADAEQLRGRSAPRWRGALPAMSSRSATRMQPTGSLGTQCHQIVVAVDHHPDHGGVISRRTARSPQCRNPAMAVASASLALRVDAGRRGQRQPTPRRHPSPHTDCVDLGWLPRGRGL
jgi:hypothetical protein